MARAALAKSPMAVPVGVELGTQLVCLASVLKIAVLAELLSRIEDGSVDRA